jgi:hypothetical protein
MTPTRQVVLDLLASPRTAGELAALTGRKVPAIMTDLRAMARADRVVQLDGGAWVDGRSVPQGLWNEAALEQVADRIFHAIRCEGEREAYTSWWLAETIGRPVSMVRAAAKMMQQDERLVETPLGWALPVEHRRI